MSVEPPVRELLTIATVTGHAGSAASLAVRERFLSYAMVGLRPGRPQ
jgi:hypothetical protein